MLRMERQRYADKRSTRDGELKANVTFVEGKHSKQVHNNHHHRHHHHHNANNNTNDDDVMKSAVETSSRSFADDVSNDQLVIRHPRHHRHRHHHRHHLQNNNNNNDSNNVESNSHNNNNNNNNNDKRHHHHHHRHRRHRHHNEQSIKAYNHDVNDDDDVADVVVGDDDDKHKKDHPHVKGKMMATDLEDISSELDEVIKQQQQQQQYQPHDYAHLTRAQVVARRHARLPRGHMDSPSVISVSSSHSSLSNKNYSHSPAVVVDNESPHGHNNQPGSVLAVKHKRNKSKNAKRSTSPTLMLMSTAMAKRSRTESRSPSQEPSDSDSSKSESSHSSQLSSGSNSDSDGSIRTHSSSSSSSSSGSGSGTGSQASDSNTSTHSAALKGELFKDAVVKVIDNNNGLDIENHVSSKETTPLNEETINGGHGETVVKCILPNYYPGVQGCRSVEEFQCLNRIEEGTYGVVYRAKDKKTDELVALKRLKMEKETEGFPITSLREINTLLKGQHPNIVTVREIVVGSNMDQIFIVMDYVEHDLKSLMQTMKTRKQSFLPSEVKCLTQQLLCAVAHLHDNWILHRDLKTSNLLLSHKGILKVADFGLAREYGSPLKRYTPVVVTLWYRAPELLLCSPEYSTPVDMWSVGCIFAEMIRMHPLFPGQTEVDQLSRIYKELGTPNEKIWPGYKELPAVKNVMSQNSQFTDFPICNLKKRFANNTTDIGIDLLQGMLTYDPSKRLTAEKALQHEYFKELPLPIDPSMFPTWPAKSELGERKAAASSPKPPPGGTQFKKQLEPGLDGDYTKGAGFQLKF